MSMLLLKVNLSTMRVRCDARVYDRPCAGERQPRAGSLQKVSMGTVVSMAESTPSSAPGDKFLVTGHRYSSNAPVSLSDGPDESFLIRQRIHRLNDLGFRLALRPYSKDAEHPGKRGAAGAENRKR